MSKYFEVRSNPLARQSESICDQLNSIDFEFRVISTHLEGVVIVALCERLQAPKPAPKPVPKPRKNVASKKTKE